MRGFALAVLFIPLVAFAEFIVPPLTGPVVDQAGMLSGEAENVLDGAFRRLKERGGSQINILTVDSLGGEEIEQASIKVTDTWKLGTGKEDNGVLFLISKTDRKMRIEVGQGLEGTLTDADSKRIIDDVVAPAFRTGNFDEGVVMGAIRIIQKTDPTVDPRELFGERVSSRRARSGERGVSLNWIVILVVFFIVFGRAFLPGGRRLSRASRYSGWGGGGGW
ncbi:MAG TPA: TPM domain-containing protein, partial [Bdellovibrionales bacterium]|nr:TPM domain-containing protein [Bdellovibrionales bacterium]